MTRLANGTEFVHLVLEGPRLRGELVAFVIEPGETRRFDFDLDPGLWQARIEHTQRTTIEVKFVRKGARMLRQGAGPFRITGGLVRVVVEWEVIPIPREGADIRRGLRVRHDDWGKCTVVAKWVQRGWWVVELPDGSRRPCNGNSLVERKAVHVFKKG